LLDNPTGKTLLLFGGHLEVIML